MCETKRQTDKQLFVRLSFRFAHPDCVYRRLYHYCGEVYEESRIRMSYPEAQ